MIYLAQFHQMTFSFVKFSFHYLLINIHINSSYTKKAPPVSGSIIEGHLAAENEFKYIVAIRQNLYEFHGAGAILDSEWIITARHVVVKTYNDYTYFNFSEKPDLYVYPKYHNNLTRYYTKVGYKVKHLYCYPMPEDINVFPADNDIALVQLLYPIPLGADSQYEFEKINWNIRRIDFDRDEIDLLAAGWGLIKNVEGETPIKPEDLRVADYKSHLPTRFLDYRPYQQFTMSNPKHEICDGDSGGPVVIRRGPLGDLLVGIISNGPKNCDGPSGQQNVEFYKKWIEKIIRSRDSEENLRKYSCENLYGKEFNNP